MHYLLEKLSPRDGGHMINLGARAEPPGAADSLRSPLTVERSAFTLVPPDSHFTSIRLCPSRHSIVPQ